MAPAESTPQLKMVTSPVAKQRSFSAKKFMATVPKEKQLKYSVHFVTSQDDKFSADNLAANLKQQEDFDAEIRHEDGEED